MPVLAGVERNLRSAMVHSLLLTAYQAHNRVYVENYIHFFMSKMYQLLPRENVASIREIQKNPSKALSGITRVMRGSDTLGFFFSKEDFDELLEDMEAASSPSLRARVKKARAGLKKDEVVSVAELAKEYGV